MVNKGTVLVVDDDIDILEQSRLFLAQDGYTVVTLGSRKEAEEYIAGSRPDLAVVDIMMETTDAGFVLCYHMRKKYPDLPIIVLTSATHDTGIDFDLTTDEERAWVKADVLLHKPVRREQLLKEVKRLITKKHNGA